MSLHDDIADEVTVFLDPEEFGEEHILDGCPIVATVEDLNDALSSGSANGFEDAGSLGLIAHRRTLRCADVLDPRPVAEQQVELDGEDWLVEKATPEMGVLVITLTRAFA